MQFQAVVWKEENMYVIKEALIGIATQGKTIEEAISNIKEALALYLEEMPEVRQDLKNVKTVGAFSVEIAQDF